ncbi:MAG: MFS transporter [Chloroflexia bacterium]
MTVRNVRAYRVYLCMVGAVAFIFDLAFTVSAIYRIQTVHLDALQLVLVGTVLEATCFIFEVPTGVVADTFSRRLSIIIGTLLLGASFLVEGSLPFFWAVLMGQVVAGLGYTFTSGAIEAWVAGEVGEESLPHVFMRAQQAGMAGGLGGIAAAVGLGSLGLNLPFLAAGVLMLGVGIVLVWVMPETGFTPTPRGERTTWGAMGQTFLDGARVVRRKPMLITFLVIAAFYGIASEGMDRLWEAHFLTNFTFPSLGAFNPVVWFGIISAGASLIGIATTELVRKRLKAERHETLVRWLVAATGLRIVGGLVFTLAGNFWVALAGIWSRSIFGAISGPLYDSWVTRTIDPQVRATVLSMMNQMNALGQISGGPAIGWVGRAFGVRAALTISVLLLAPSLPLYWRAHRQGNDEPAQSASMPTIGEVAAVGEAEAV